MRLVRIVTGAALLLLVALATGLFVVGRYLQSPAFKQAVLRSAHDALGSDVQIGEIRVSLFSGVTLERVAVANPPGFPGEFLRADALRLRYRLWPLLRKRLEIQQVALEAPVITLSRDERGEWSFERLGRRPASAPSPPARLPGGAASAPAEGPATPGPMSALDIFLPRLAVERGRVLVTGERDRPLARLDQLDLGAAVTWTGGTLAGRGQADVQTVAIGDALFVRKLAAPLAFTATEVKLSPLTGALAGGALSGAVTVSLAGGPRYHLDVRVKDADVQQLLREAGASRPPISGRLQARAKIRGTGGLATARGTGRVEIVNGQLVDVPVLTTLELLLQVPGLRSLHFDECWVDFTLAGNTLRTPALRVAASDIQITGQGTVSLETRGLDHHLTLALPERVVGRAPREVRTAFTDRGDGWRTLEFRVWGPYDAPRTDLSDRLLKGVTESFLKRGLRKLFK